MKTVTSNRPAHGLLFPILLRRASGLDGIIPQKNTENLRLEQMLAEQAWAAFHIWDRTRRGIFPKGTFEATGGALLCGLLKTAGGGTWWRTAKQIGFPPGFVSDVDAVLARNGGASTGVNSRKEPLKT